LIVDQVGFLAGLYRSAQIAVVGGGFTRGVHNVLEPAALGIPVLMGPNYGKSPEVVTLCREGGAKKIDSEDAMEATLLTLLSDSNEHKTMGEMALQNVWKNLNATERTLAVLRSTFPVLFPTVIS
jgi:3-deoxy-D-manno-octulosonic-acid transferase